MGISLAPTGAGMVIWNPSNEDIDMQYAGVSFTLKSGEKRDFDVNVANYIINSFGVRGLTPLKYGDEPNEKKLGDDGIARNMEFKKRQITLYNQQNENRKHMNLGYQPPSEILKRYAIELGLKLLEPFTVRDEERAAISKSSIENEELKQKLAVQEKEMAELKDMMKQFMSREIPPDTDDKPDRPKERPNWKKT